MATMAFDRFDVPTAPARDTARRRFPGPRRFAGWEEREAVFRRRRLAVAVLLMLVAFAAGVLAAVTLVSSPAGGSLTEQARRARQVTYVVQPGDTLWSVAGALAPGEDPRVVVDALAAERGTSTILPGDVVAWPPA